MVIMATCAYTSICAYVCEPVEVKTGEQHKKVEVSIKRIIVYFLCFVVRKESIIWYFVQVVIDVCVQKVTTIRA